MQQLTDKQLLRYDRQITLKGFDIDKQVLLYNQSALIIGVGGLGCSAALYLASSGIGRLTLVDFDTVSASNLSRQILYTEPSVNQKKVLVAQHVLQQHNPDMIVTTIDQQLDDKSLRQQISQHDIVLDCSDNIATREQINRCCYQLKKPLISGAAIRMEGLLSVFTYQPDAPCYHCLSMLFGQDELTCVEAGVMAPLVGMMGSLQALEAVKVLTQYGQPLVQRLLMVDVMTMQFNELSLMKQANCPVCSK